MPDKSGWHDCPADTCDEQVPPDKLLCWSDWRRVPLELQRALYGAWRRGQGAGTPEYAAAMRACVDAANAKRARRG